MKVLIVSDTHGQHRNLEQVLDRVCPLDLLIHLGDVEGGEKYINQIAKCPTEIIGGNNDYFSELDKEREIQIGRYRILLTHGHYYYVTVGMENIKKEAISRNIDIVMFGHTHRPVLELNENLTAINPGSLSYPRQEGRKPSFIIMEIDKNGEAHYTLNYIGIN